MESDLQALLLLRLPHRFPDLRVWRRNILKVRIGKRTMRAGVKGQADLYGYWRGGQGIELELKSAAGSSTPEQRAWAAMCQDWGVMHLVLKARRDEEPKDTVERWCDEIAACSIRQVRASVQAFNRRTTS
jgi:hypothetical protein